MGCLFENVFETIEGIESVLKSIGNSPKEVGNGQYNKDNKMLVMGKNLLHSRCFDYNRSLDIILLKQILSCLVISNTYS